MNNLLVRNPSKNLIIVRAGDNSLHPEWIKDKEAKNFDVFVSYYGNSPELIKEKGEYFESREGLYWPPMTELCKEYNDLISSYDYIALPDDDISADTQTWNNLFNLAYQLDLDLAQPAILGYPNFKDLSPQPNVLLRYTNFVEIMTPIFNINAFKKVEFTFSESECGWGLDNVWAELLPYPKYKLAVIDRFPVCHTRTGMIGPIYTLLKKLKINPYYECRMLYRKFDITMPQIIEYDRIIIND